MVYALFALVFGDEIKVVLNDLNRSILPFVSKVFSFIFILLCVWVSLSLDIYISLIRLMFYDFFIWAIGARALGFTNNVREASLFIYFFYFLISFLEISFSTQFFISQL